MEITNLTPERQQVWNKINQMMDESYGCAEAFVTAVGEYVGGEVDPAVKKISTGFSGGVGGSHEELCGGVSGAAIIVGLLYGRTTNDEAKMIRCKRLISEHRDRFVQEFGTTVCQELRDAQFGADEQNPCSAMIAPAAFALLDILEDEEERERTQAAAETGHQIGDVLGLEAYIAAHKNDSSEQLLQELNRPELTPGHRNWIGLRLNERGDDREGVGLLSDQELPHICWENVPGGEVAVERAGRFDLDPFLISRYPITHVQFQAFLNAADGYQNPVWWQGLGESPEQGLAPSEQRFDVDNHPRDNVSWYEAVAFCRWLTGLYVNCSELAGNPLEEQPGWVIRLPAEWEWQMAATGGNPENKFPWGLEWDENRAHTKHNQLNKSMTVGMYPAGRSPVGAYDMSGNIWEWCLNCYEDPGRLDLSRTDRRVLRGGSWYHWGSYAHVDMRVRYYPDHRYNAGGFRIVCAKPID